MGDGPKSVTDYFQYQPSLALNIVALVLFSVITAILALQTLKYKQKYMWIIVCTGGVEIAGYICHLIATEAVNLGAYIANLVLIILAPNFLALANYVTVGKIAEQLELSGRFLNTKSIATGFFIIDIICIAVQGGGSAVISSKLQEDGVASQSGETVVLIGLAIQLFFFAGFTVVTAYVYYLQWSKALSKVRIELYIGLLVTIVLITIRNIYRVIEIAVGWAGKYNTQEKYFYCLDALPIFLAFCAYSLLHFGRYLEAPLALQLPSNAREVVIDDSSKKTKQPKGTTSFGKSMLSWGRKDRTQHHANGVTGSPLV